MKNVVRQVAVLGLAMLLVCVMGRPKMACRWR